MLGSSYPVVDGYWADRIELVFDSSRKWVHTIFESSDGIKFEIGGNTVMGEWTSEPVNGAKSIKRVHNGWDHEHCAICHVSINEKGEHKSGYKDDSGKWVCNNCYESYVLPKSLDFMELESI